MNKNLRVLVLACCAVILASVLLVSASFALYTDSIKQTNHLESGNMNITLTRDKITSNKLNNDGFLEEFVDEQNINFSGQTDENIFGITKNDKIVPLSSYKADMMISNCSDVAFGYYLEILIDDGKVNELSKQLLVTVTTDKEYVFDLSKGLFIGSESEYLDILKVGDTKYFSVEVLFKDLDNNNDAMNQEVYFDLVVHAVQVTKAN